MKAKLCAAAGVVLAVGLGLGVNWDGDRPADGPRAAAAPAPAPATTNAFLFGVSVPRKRDPREGPRMGIDAERVEWWLGDPDGSNLRLLDDPRTGRVKVRPVDRTVILGRDADGVTLLGPDGGDVFLSLKRGPLPKAEIHASGQRTTFAFTPDGKAVVFANKKGNLCRIDLAAQELTVSDVAGVNAADGVQFSPDGKRVAYSRYRRTDDRKPGLHGVCVAAADFTGEKLLTEASSISGFGFRPDGRVAVLDPRSVRAFDPETGKEEVVSGPWKNPVPARSFGGFNPDGSSFIFNTGGPYVLNLYAVDLKTTKITKVKDQYLESFQEMVWVRVPKGK